MPINFNQYPYYDDFNEDNLYYRLLFQPGRAVQARELTQIQTLLQSQLSKFGSHIFKDGAAVFNGQVAYDRTHTHWLALKPQAPNGGGPVRIRDISPGMTIQTTAESGSGRPVGRVVSVIPAENDDPDTIYFKWASGEPAVTLRSVPGQDTGFYANENLRICDAESGIARYEVTTLEEDGIGPRHYGTAATFSVAPGIYYWNGMFIKGYGGAINLLKYSNTPTYRIGYTVSEEIVQDDPKSYDPSQGTSNYAAPGADRYKIELTLIKIGDGLVLQDSPPSSFIEIASIESGLVTATPADQTIYNVLAEEFATRTFEESGNYIAKPYTLEGGIQNKTTDDSPKMVAKIGAGVSYVGGYRHGLSQQRTVDIDKARATVTEDIEVRPGYGDNFLHLYDHAGTFKTADATVHPDNANGFFVIGSGAGQYTTSDLHGQHGTAVAIHSVPISTVKNHSATDQDTWKSTLVGTARPIQMLYNQKATGLGYKTGRRGDVYTLWLGDFKSSPISNTTGATNIIKDVSAHANVTHTVYYFSSQSHGLTANDRISVTGSVVSDWNVDREKVLTANATAVVLSGKLTSAAAPQADVLTLTRVTGNNSPYRTVVLDQASSAALNSSYVGATIRVGNSSPRTIVEYVGTNSRAETLYNARNGWSKRGMVTLDRDLDELPVYGSKYTLNLTMKQARSVVYNKNISSTGADQYPVQLSQTWNVDPVNGIEGAITSGAGQTTVFEKLNDETHGNRVDGEAKYNWAQPGRGHRHWSGRDGLMFSSRRSSLKSIVTHGNIDEGKTSNTTVYYTERSVATHSGGGTAQAFTPPSAVNYKFFNRPKPYPYENSTVDGTIDGGLNHIKNNFMLLNRTTGENITRKINTVVVTSVYTMTVNLNEAFVHGDEYILNYTVKAENAKPAYKKLVTANNKASITRKSNGDLTDFSRGQIVIQEGTYSTNAGARISLLKPDGYRLSRVVQNLNNSQANTDLANSQIVVTEKFDFDTGQRDMFYDNCALVLKSDVQAPSGNLFVCFDYFQRMDGPKSTSSPPSENIVSPSYFAVDSYQCTTDLIFGAMTGTFKQGDKIGNTTSGVFGYVVDFANTAGAGVDARVRLEGVTSPTSKGGNSSVFTVGEIVGKSASYGKIKEIIPADLKYNKIPKYTDRGKRTYQLRNLLDFRPYVSSNNRTSDIISSGFMTPVPSFNGIYTGRNHRVFATHSRQISSSIKAESYAGRIDKIIVTKDGNYVVKPGVHGTNPFPPRDPAGEEGLTLFTLQIPAYTTTPRHVQIKKNLATRHTMKDISRLAKRVENLEYYVSLNALERAASETTITDASGMERFKNGIVVDDFTNDSIMDVRNGRQQAAVGKGFLRPLQVMSDAYNAVGEEGGGTHGLKLIKNSLSGTVFDSEDEDRTVIMLDHTITPAITQPYATTAENVNPFDIQNFTGTLKLTPDYDRWVDTTKVPEYDVSIDGGGQSIAIGDGSSRDTIMGIFQGIDELWNIVAKNVSLGEDIEGTALVNIQNEDGSFETETVSRDISLGAAQYGTGTQSAKDQIDAAIEHHGLTEGTVQNTKILPYIRGRDIIVDAKGLKPKKGVTLFFENIIMEGRFQRATEIYMQMDGNQEFQPQIVDPGPAEWIRGPGTAKAYEKITLSDRSGTRTANAILIAVRDPDPIIHQDDRKLARQNIKIGYIVPVFGETTGKIDYANYEDGFYDSGWSVSEILESGFQGRNSSRSVTGKTSGASAKLIAGGTEHLYNGHYTGTVRNQDANTTHIILSPDARRYIAKNFGDENPDPNVGVGKECMIKIVAGQGRGQQCIANNLLSYTEQGGCPVIELRTSSDGTTTGLQKEIKDADGNVVQRSNHISGNLSHCNRFGKSVYSLCMAPIDKDSRSHEINQVGSAAWTKYGKTNHHGDKFGVFNLPNSTRSEWTLGKKLVEIANHGSNLPWMVDSYASTTYFAEGSEQAVTQDSDFHRSARRLRVLNGIRSKLNKFEVSQLPMNDNDHNYVPATNNETNEKGKLAVVTKIVVANGIYTGLNTDGVAFRPGAAKYGTVAKRTELELKNNIVGVWLNIRNNHPEIYEKYYKHFADQIIKDHVGGFQVGSGL